MNDITLFISSPSQGLIDGLRKAIDQDETIDIKVPGGIFTVSLDAIEVDS